MSRDKKKKLPVVTSSKPKSTLRAAPVSAETASRPEFPRRADLRKGSALVTGAAMLAAGGFAAAKDAAAPPKEGTVDGAAIAKKAPKIKMHREGGGIGPSQVVWEVEDVEAFLNWKFAHDGHLDIKTAYALDLGDGMKVTLDGYDPAANIGYEFVYGDDDEEFTDKAVARLGDWMKAKKAAVLVINMSGTPDESTLSKKVAKFFAAVKKNPPAAGPMGSATDPSTPPPTPAPKK
jgi:hypothetical protein